MYVYFCNNPKQWQIPQRCMWSCPCVSAANYPACSAFGEGEDGSLHQLYARPVTAIWDSTYSAGNSIHVGSKCKKLWCCPKNCLTGLWSWTYHSKHYFLYPFLLRRFVSVLHPQHYCFIAFWFPKLRGQPSVIITECVCINRLLKWIWLARYYHINFDSPN